MKKITLEQVLEHILREMCLRVNAKYEDVDFKEELWFTKYEWTSEEEDSFKQWMINYLTSNEQALKILSKYPSILNAERITNEFIFNYGWKTNCIV